MIKCIACFKWVMDEQTIKSSNGSSKLNLENANFKISENDKNAIETAMCIKEQYDGSVVAVTVGNPSTRRSIKDALARGPEAILYINAPEFTDPEPSVTSSILAAAIKGLPYDIIFCGVGSNDLYAQQVGPELAEKLGIPCLTYVSDLQVMEEKQQVIAKRRLDNEVETVSVHLPVLVTVLPNINEPRIPGLTDILEAGQKDIIEINCNDLQEKFIPALHTTNIIAANMERKCLKFSSDQNDLQKIVNGLARMGLIS